MVRKFDHNIMLFVKSTIMHYGFYPLCSDCNESLEHHMMQLCKSNLVWKYYVFKDSNVQSGFIERLDILMAKAREF